MPVIPRLQEMFAGRTITTMKRKAASVARKAGFEPVTQDGWTLYCWSNGGGDSSAWFFRSGGKSGTSRSTADAGEEILVLTFDHASDLNLYDAHFVDQVGLYRGLPDAMRTLVENRLPGDPFLSPTHSDLLRWARPSSAEGPNDLPEATVPATGIFWFDGEDWWITDGLQDYIDTHEDVEILDTGIGFCLRPFLP